MQTLIEQLNKIKGEVQELKKEEDFINYNASSEEIEETLYQLIRDFSGIEFNLPKISETNPLLRYIYNSVCESESNMCHIDRETWEMLKEEENFKNTDLEELAKDIKKYSLSICFNFF